MKKTRGQNNKGFTLIELLVAMTVTGIVMSSTYLAYQSQQESYVVQEQVAAIQDNIRSAMYYMESEIRMAGCDPTRDANAGFVTADSGILRFTQDIHDGLDNDADGTVDEPDEVGDCDGFTDDFNEDISYTLYDEDGDGDTDLGRSMAGGALQPVAENIDALDFVYLDERVGDGIDNNLNGVVDEQAEAVMATPVFNTQDIRVVQVSLVVRAERPDRDFTNNFVYRNQQGAVILDLSGAPDSFRRRQLTLTMTCRNMGL
jgi:type IV pilus assembly protein PilW